MHGLPEDEPPERVIDVLPDAEGGAVYEHLDELPQWLAVRLCEPDLTDKIAKLRTTERDELHLFLRIHDTAMPFSLYYPLAFSDYVPSHPLSVLLMNSPACGSPLLGRTRSSGGERTQVGAEQTASIDVPERASSSVSVAFTTETINQDPAVVDGRLRRCRLRHPDTGVGRRSSVQSLRVMP